MVFQAEDRAKAKKQHADQAIQLALQGRWSEAAQLNRDIIASFPNDMDAFNRLGKAMTELGRYADARGAYMKALEIDPLNSIADKNLKRLSTLGEKEAAPRPAGQKLSPQMFIEETGKTGITVLVRPNMDIAARMTAGDQVNLQRQNGSLVIQSIAGEYIGEVEPRLGQRLIKLMDAGNEYIAAISGLGEKEVRLFIRETFQHGSQTRKLSFPPTVTETFRPYVKGSRLLHRDAEDDESYFDESDERDDWAPGGEEGEEAEGTTNEFRLSTDDAPIAVDDGDEDEE
ncbi:MAG TPA: tetratricopeptide repeat protein [Dehalococcoidia bacterium]|nr:tetratricopeptide repeat protein [Dehalococcoidia bacterium]